MINGFIWNYFLKSHVDLRAMHRTLSQISGWTTLMRLANESKSEWNECYFFPFSSSSISGNSLSWGLSEGDLSFFSPSSILMSPVLGFLSIAWFVLKVSQDCFKLSPEKELSKSIWGAKKGLRSTCEATECGLATGNRIRWITGLFGWGLLKNADGLWCSEVGRKTSSGNERSLGGSARKLRRCWKKSFRTISDGRFAKNISLAFTSIEKKSCFPVLAGKLA